MENERTVITWQDTDSNEIHSRTFAYLSPEAIQLKNAIRLFTNLKLISIVHN